MTKIDSIYGVKFVRGHENFAGGILVNIKHCDALSCERSGHTMNLYESG